MNNIISSQKFFLYARKSTDVEDKQVRSIEDQIAELRTFAKQENLNIVEIFIEKQSAKIPGRPIFNKMLNKIEQGEANGILAWHADRLARNSVDGGRIIYLLDTSKLASLKFPTLWFENTPQGKFMLNIVFGQSKYYVDSLSENTKRGLRQKVKRGEYPGPAPIGYINDSRTKSVVVDRKKAKVIRGAFELYAEGNSRLEDISNFLAQRGILSRGGKRIHKTRATFILSNPFYTGLFKYGGELHEGKYEPIIAKKIFDKVQEVLKQRGRPHHKTKYEPQDYCGLLRCGTCGMSITGEYRVKKQKNGNTHDYIYYHCTKKNKSIKCPELCIRQEELDKQISSLLQKFSLRADWAEKLLQMAKNEKDKSAQSVSAFFQESQNQIRAINEKLQRLLDGYLEQDIEREIYREQKTKLLMEKKSLEEKIARIEQKQNDWLEPMKEWIKVASNLVKIARDSNLLEKKVAAKEIFGSNLRLASRAVRGEPVFPFSAALSAAESIGKIPESLILVRDSKIVPGPQRDKLAQLIKERCWFQVKIFHAPEVDIAVRDRNRTLNGLELEAMSDLLRDFMDEHAEREAVALVDAPSVSAQHYLEKLYAASGWPDMERLKAKHEADRTDRTVAAASLIAKSERERLIAKIKKDVGVDFGCGYAHDEATREFVKTCPRGAACVRWSWETAKINTPPSRD